jgi:hypothetical protein
MEQTNTKTASPQLTLREQLPVWIVVGVALFINFLAYGLHVLPDLVATIARWIGLAGLAYLAYRRGSITTWILFALILGAEVGHTLPGGAEWYNVAKCSLN